MISDLLGKNMFSYLVAVVIPLQKEWHYFRDL